MVAVLASSVSAPTLSVSLPVGEKRGVHTSDYAVRINVARVKDGPLTLTVQESGLEPRGPVPGHNFRVAPERSSGSCGKTEEGFQHCGLG